MMVATASSVQNRGRLRPKRWAYPLLADVARRESGHTPDKNEPSYWDGGIKWLSLTDCERLNRVYISDTSRTISAKGIANSSARLLPAGVVVLSRDAGVGQSAITTCEMAVSQHFLAWECSDAINPIYLYNWFQFLRPELERIAVGSTIKTIGLRYFDKLRIPLPGISEQKRIAAALLAIDRVCFSLEENIAAKREFKRGLAQQLLTGQKRFSKFRSTPRHTSSLDAHVKPVTRRNAHGCTLVLTASGEHGLVDQRRYFNRRVAGADLSKYYLLRRGEFAYNRSAMGGYPYGATKRLDDHDEGALSVLYLCFAISDPKLDSNFLRHVLESGVLNRQLRPIVRVGARAHGLLNVTDDDFLSISVPFPAIAEQRAIARVLDQLEDEIKMLIAQRENYAIYKRGLLTRLLSGELSVPS